MPVAKCLLAKMTACKMFVGQVGQMIVDQMTVGQMSVRQIFVGQMSVRQIFEGETYNGNIHKMSDG
jgi:hypothetical protein